MLSGEIARYERRWMVQFITRWYLSELPKQLREQGIKRNWKQCCAKVKNLKTNIEKLQMLMAKQAKEGNYASFTINYMKFCGTGQLQCLHRRVFQCTP